VVLIADVEIGDHRCLSVGAVALNGLGCHNADRKAVEGNGPYLR